MILIAARHQRLLCGNEFTSAHLQTKNLMLIELSNSHTTGCPPVRGDNPRALASGLSYVQVGKHGITFFYTTYISVDLAHHEIFHAQV